jgi:hypothetical protein
MGDDPPDGFIALWRRAHRRVRPDEVSVQWLEEQIRSAMPHSLTLVLDLYYYWASMQHGIIRREDQARVRRAVYQMSRELFRAGQDLIRVTHPERRYDLYQLVFPPGDQDEGPSEYRGVSHWNWLGPIVLDALRREPHLFAFKIAHLIAEGRRGEVLADQVYQTIPERLHDFFGNDADQVIELLTQERDRVAGSDREFLDQVVRTARPIPAV